jgi:hypothetical protein
MRSEMPRRHWLLELSQLRIQRSPKHCSCEEVTSRCREERRAAASRRSVPIERYEHSDKKRINNPPVGLVTPETDPVAPTHKTYDYVAPVPSVKPRQELDYDPHLDPQLVWAGKKEHTARLRCRRSPCTCMSGSILTPSSTPCGSATALVLAGSAIALRAPGRKSAAARGH